MIRHALSVIALLMPVYAVYGQAPSLPEVTVTAPRPPTAHQLAGDSVPVFVKSHGKPAVLTGQLARWVKGVCPTSMGLSPAFNDFVTARIQAVATSVGAPRATEAPCRPNVAIYFTNEPQKLLDDVVAHASELLGFHYPNQTKKLATVDRPIQAWYVTATRGANGVEFVDDIWGLPPPGRLGSRLATGKSSHIIFVLVVADANKLTSYSVGSISDYIAVLTLSRPVSLTACEALPSIIDLMSPVCGARSDSFSVTAGDGAYLRALYSVNMQQPLSLQRSDIQNKMTREFEKPR
jgi:hypothetical protein